MASGLRLPVNVLGHRSFGFGVQDLGFGSRMIRMERCQDALTYRGLRRLGPLFGGPHCKD